MGKVIYIQRCSVCKGTGKVTQQLMHNSQVYSGEGICATCNGRGMLKVKKEEYYKKESNDENI